MYQSISIHAPRKAERLGKVIENNNIRNFNPRSAQGGATAKKLTINQSAWKFQSTLRARRSDLKVPKTAIDKSISIHAPRKAERRVYRKRRHHRRYFNPRSAQGGATELLATGKVTIKISIHAPRKAERLNSDFELERLNSISIHAPRKAERRCFCSRTKHKPYISIHAPRKAERRGGH